ncbi:hypothetical protein [Aurantiacibacter poecillastricola]|uniref:hypothetical protein n=1 Tax=Aurantiacibacter poecillastricola TaxID=3064385 RepID=UPI00273FC3AF|nr:hypothetical protein [Aurantiacibacter sp. 219JJ12-13]MDP5261768.1 hypothetical protein [Aurantiacibacter sp. 219JJ12-13]
MIVQLIVFLAVIVVPFPIGFVLAHYRPESRRWVNALFAALPVALPCFAYALYLTLVFDLSAEDGAGENMATIWAMAFYVIGILTGVTGFGVGLLGDAYARNRAKKDVE